MAIPFDDLSKCNIDFAKAFNSFDDLLNHLCSKYPAPLVYYAIWLWCKEKEKGTIL